MKPVNDNDLLDPASGIYFSAVVVNYNEARHLSRCLDSLGFCDQIILVDLGSQDNSIEIAQQHNVELIHHTRVEIVEQLRAEVLPNARNDWIIYIDPDEVAPASMHALLTKAILDNPCVGLIRYPSRYYFRQRPLMTTVWGFSGTGKPLVVHRQRVIITPFVHAGYALKEGFCEIRIPFREEAAIQHFWADSYGQLFEKHRRYLAHEGRSRYDRGQRFSWFRMIAKSLWTLKLDLFDYRGVIGGVDAWGLSLFHTWYTWKTWLSLRQYQASVPRSASEA